ncbi:hypothetical protein ABPG74_017947 [Tetrahymena malaccensis]
MIIALNYVYARPYEHPVSFLQSKQFILERSECLINQGGPSSLVNYQAEFSQNLKGLQNNDCIGAKQITCNSSNRIVVSGDNCKTSTNFVVQKSSNTVIQNIYLEINFLVDSNQTFPASSVYSINGQNFPQSGNFSQWCDNTSTLYYHLTEIKTDIGSKSLNIQFQPNSATSYRTYVFGFVLAVQYVCPSNCDKCNDTGQQAHIQAFPKIQLMNEEQQPKISSSTPPQTNLIIPSQLFQNIPFQKSPKEIQSTQSSQRTQQVLYARRKRAKFQQLQNQEKFPISSLNNLSQNQLGFNQLQIVKQTSNLDQNENHQNSLQIISQNEIKDHQQDHPIKQQELLKPQFSQNNNDESQDPIYHFLSYKNLIPKVKLKIEFICLKYTFYVGSECLINQGGPSSLTDNTAEFNQNLKGLQQNDCIGAKQITCKGNNEIVLSSDNCKSNTQFSIQKNSNNVIQSIYLEINFLIDSSKSFAGSSIYHVNNQNFPKNDYFAQWCDTTSTLYFRITTINANINSNSLTIQFQPDSATSYSTIVYGFVLAVQYICPQNCAKCDSNTCLQCSPNYQIINDINKQCQPCDSTCQSCTGSKNTDCSVCRPDLHILQQIQSVEEDQQPKIGSPSLPQGNQVISSLLFTKSLKEFQPTINQKLPYSRRKRTKFLQLQTQEKLTQNNNQL